MISLKPLDDAAPCLRLGMEKRLMDVTKILGDLRLERERIDQAILSLERLTLPTGKRRGRPPKWMAEAKAREMNTRPATAQASAQVN